MTTATSAAGCPRREREQQHAGWRRGVININPSLAPPGSQVSIVTRFISSVRCASVVAPLLRVLPSPPPPPPTMVRSLPRPVVATSIVSLFSIFIPVSARVDTPFRPRAHAVAIQHRSFHDVDAGIPTEKAPLEVQQHNERGLLGDVLSGVGDVVNNVVGGSSATPTTSNPPANSTPATPATTPSQGTSAGNSGTAGNPGTTATVNGSGNPTSPNAQTTQTNAPSATASNPSQQTSKAGSGATGETPLPRPALNPV
jgi:hypothetical protein